MTKENILREVETSTWQPVFETTDDLNEVTNNILAHHEDSFLKGLSDIIKDIIVEETTYFNEYCLYKENAGVCNLCGAPKKGPTSSFCSKCGRFGKIEQYRIDFNMLCQWQKQLFEGKKEIISYYYEELDNDNLNKEEVERLNSIIKKIEKLPNLYINLGLRQSAGIKVNNWIPPQPMFLEELKNICFPIIIIDKDAFFLRKESFFRYLSEETIIKVLTHWYKCFQTIHFFEDLNGRLGNIVINILFYNLTGKYLIENEQSLL